MVGDRRERQLRPHIEQLRHVGHLPERLARHAVLELEWTEHQILVDVVAHGLEEGGRVLARVLEAEAARDVRVLGVVRLVRLHQDRQLGLMVTDVSRKLEAGAVRLNPILREAQVGDHAHHVVAVPVVHVERLLEVGAQDDLGARRHAKHPLARVHRLRLDRLVLAPELRVEHRQVGRVELDRVLDD